MLSKPALIEAATGLPPLSLIILMLPIILSPLPFHPNRMVWLE